MYPVRLRSISRLCKRFRAGVGTFSRRGKTGLDGQYWGDAARQGECSGGLRHAGGWHLAHTRTAKRFSTSIQLKGGCCRSFPGLHDCCSRPQTAPHASRAPTRHLDPDMRTARKKASGTGHGPGRGGLGRSRYIEFTAGQRRARAAIAFTRLRMYKSQCTISLATASQPAAIYGKIAGCGNKRKLRV